MAQYNIPQRIADKCRNNYDFDIEDAIKDRLADESMNALSKRYNISRSYLSDMFREIGVDTTNTKLGKQHLIDQDWLYKEYVNKGRTQASIAEELDIGKNTVNRLIAKLGWEHKLRPQFLCDKYNIDRTWLKEQVEERNRTISSISRELGISMSTLRRAINEENLHFDNDRKRQRKAGTQQLTESLSLLKAQIESGKITPKELSNKFDISLNNSRNF